MRKEDVTSRLNKNYDRIHAYHVKALYLFGSVVRSESTDKSDVDILVEFDPDARIGLFEFSRLQRTLSEILGCQVDLATPDSLHKSLKARIMKEAVRAA
jgi:predicted nucleotidyltransferase